MPKFYRLQDSNILRQIIESNLRSNESLVRLHLKCAVKVWRERDGTKEIGLSEKVQARDTKIKANLVNST